MSATTAHSLGRSKGYEGNGEWESERVAALRSSVRNSRLTAAIACAVAFVACVALIKVESARQFVPIPIVVDRNTGETTTTLPLSSDSVPTEEALDKANVTRFVVAREGYAWDFLQRDYNTVSRMASPEVFKPYSALFDGTDPLDKKLGAKVVWLTRVVNVRLDLSDPRVTGKKGTRAGEAVVTYERIVRDAETRKDAPPARAVATLRYEYQPKSMRTEADRLENPLGFVVTAYRSDAEVSK